MDDQDYKKIAQVCYAIGSLRRIPRSHRQSLMVNDSADNIGSHSHRVACIAFMLAKLEGADPYKVTTMALFHDVPETRTGDQNWVHKRYIHAEEDRVITDQFSDLPFSELSDFIAEYGKRQSLESKVAKDADLIDQILLLKEYEWTGNKEATVWLTGKTEGEDSTHVSMLKTDSAKKLARKILEENPSSWWKGISTHENK